MAAATYTPIQSITLTTATATVTLGSGGTISQAYTDLVLVSNIQGTTNDQGVYIQFNGDTTSKYSYTILLGTGSVASSQRLANSTYNVLAGYNYGVASTGSTFTPSVAHIMNYSNASTYKTTLVRAAPINNASGWETETFVNLYRSTSAITSLSIYMSSGNVAAGSTFTLYGIAAA